MDCSKIPYCTGTGNFLRITGNFSEGTGNSGDRIKASTWKQTSQRAQGDQKGDQRLRKSDRLPVPHAAFEHIADAELAPNLADIERPGPYKANERVSER